MTHSVVYMYYDSLAASMFHSVVFIQTLLPQVGLITELTLEPLLVLFFTRRITERLVSVQVTFVTELFSTKLTGMTLQRKYHK